MDHARTRRLRPCCPHHLPPAAWVGPSRTRHRGGRRWSPPRRRPGPPPACRAPPGTSRWSPAAGPARPSSPSTPPARRRDRASSGRTAGLRTRSPRCSIASVGQTPSGPAPVLRWEQSRWRPSWPGWPGTIPTVSTAPVSSSPHVTSWWPTCAGGTGTDRDHGLAQWALRPRRLGGGRAGRAGGRAPPTGRWPATWCSGEVLASVGRRARRAGRHPGGDRRWRPGLRGDRHRGRPRRAHGELGHHRQRGRARRPTSRAGPGRAGGEPRQPRRSPAADVGRPRPRLAPRRRPVLGRRLPRLAGRSHRPVPLGPHRRGRSRPPGARGLVAVPWFGGARAPWWRDGARAGFVGASLDHDAGDFARAAVESVAAEVRRCLVGRRSGRAA